MPAVANNIDPNTQITRVIHYVYGDPCRFYDFRQRHPKQCGVDAEIEYDAGITLFPFFGNNWSRKHHHNEIHFHNRNGMHHDFGNRYNNGFMHHRGRGHHH